MTTGHHQQADAGNRMRIPADVDREDRLLANLTARQLAILAVAGTVLWAVWIATRTLVPLPVFAAFAAPAAGVAVTLAVGRWHGLPADRLLAAIARQRLTPSRLIPAPDGIPFTPNLPDLEDGGIRLGPLGLPIAGIGEDGVLDLGAHGHAVLLGATAVSFVLRTGAEREGLAEGFGRWLNSLATPVQILISARPVDLTPPIRELRHAAPGLPHPLLEAACLAHADYLAEFAASTQLLRRDVTLVLRHPAPATIRRGAKAPTRRATGMADPAAVLARLAGDAVAALAAAGVSVTVLDGPAAAARLTASLNPHTDPAGDSRAAGVMALPGAVIRQART
jgi:hypothetical protein